MASLSPAASRKRVTQAFRSLIDEFLGFRAEFKSAYDSAIAVQMERLRDLDNLESSDKKRIGMAVEDAARCYFAAHWSRFFSSAIGSRNRMKAAIGVIAAPLVIIFLYLVPWPSRPDSPDLIVLVPILLFIVADIGSRLNSRMPYRYLTAVEAIEAVASFAVVSTFRLWDLRIHFAWKAAISALSPVHRKFRAQIASLPVAQALQWALFLIGVTCATIVIWKFIRFMVRVVISGKEDGYGRPALQCADVIIRLLTLGDLITELTNPIIAASADLDNYSRRRDQITTRSWNSMWGVVNFQLGQLVYSIKGPWREAMRSRYRPAGEYIAGEAPRIELYIRHLQVKNALLSNNLLELRDAITSALVHAADGNWHLIGAEEEYANKAIARRRTRIIRRAILIALSIAATIAAAHFMRNYPALAVTCGLFAFAELLRLLDPDGPSLLDVAGRVANTLKRSG
jgi:hypothetical protein